jgi:hypothetical protein
MKLSSIKWFAWPLNNPRMNINNRKPMSNTSNDKLRELLYDRSLNRILKKPLPDTLVENPLFYVKLNQNSLSILRMR